MVSDPYQTLGVAPGASQEDIKRAYRKKAKENHPDLHPDDPMAAQRMNEINEAYDLLTHPEKYQARQRQQQAQQGQGAGGYSWQGNPFGQQGGGYNPFGQQSWGTWRTTGEWVDLDDLFGFGGFQQGGAAHMPREEGFDTPEIRAAVRAINRRAYQEAIELLIRIPGAGRNARWHYLLALAQYGAGNTMTAQEEMQRAAQMDPGQPIYQQLLQQYRRAGQSYTQRARGFNMGAADPSRICMTFCLANLFCNCCCRGF